MRNENVDFFHNLHQKFILGLLRPEFLKTINGSSEKNAYLDIYGLSPKDTHFLAKRYSSKRLQISQKILSNSPKDTHAFLRLQAHDSPKDTLLINIVEYEELQKKEFAKNTFQTLKTDFH